MNDTDWKILLEARLAEIVNSDQISESARQSVDLDQTRVGRLSRMDAMQAQSMNQAIARRRQQETERIRAALERIDDDEFGYCIKCGEEIAAKRLMLDPSIPNCTGCAG